MKVDPRRWPRSSGPRSWRWWPTRRAPIWAPPGSPPSRRRRFRRPRGRRAAYVEALRLGADGPLVPAFGESVRGAPRAVESARPPLEGAEILALAGCSPPGPTPSPGCAEPRSPAGAHTPAGWRGRPLPLVARAHRVLDRKGRCATTPRRAWRAPAQIQGTRERLYGRLERLRGEHAELFARRRCRCAAVAPARPPGGCARPHAGLVHGRSARAQLLLRAARSRRGEQPAADRVDEQEAERRRLLDELLSASPPSCPWSARWPARWRSSTRWRPRGASARPPARAWPRSRRRAAAPGRRPSSAARPAARRSPRARAGRGGSYLAAVPLDLELDAARRILVVTGPNAAARRSPPRPWGCWPWPRRRACRTLRGGLGAAAAVERGRHVGDEQDLLAERSTFSGRLQRLAKPGRRPTRSARAARRARSGPIPRRARRSLWRCSSTCWRAAGWR